MIVNRIRWETDVMTTDKDYKINNDYKPFYSRLFMAEHKQYENFFRKNIYKYTKVFLKKPKLSSKIEYVCF